MIPSEITETYREYSLRFSGKAGEFPFGTTPGDMGETHLEVSDDGKMALVVTERGKEVKRQETYSVDELLYWVFKGKANSRAFYRPVGGRSHADKLEEARDLIAKVKPEWAERMQKEQSAMVGKL